MNVKVLELETAQSDETGEYVAVRTSRDPMDQTITLATIERVITKTVRKEPTDPPWHVKTLVLAKPMSTDAAIGLATLYAERKHIPVIYTDSER